MFIYPPAFFLSVVNIINQTRTQHCWFRVWIFWINQSFTSPSTQYPTLGRLPICFVIYSIKLISNKGSELLICLTKISIVLPRVTCDIPSRPFLFSFLQGNIYSRVTTIPSHNRKIEATQIRSRTTRPVTFYLRWILDAFAILKPLVKT